MFASLIFFFFVFPLSFVTNPHSYRKYPLFPYALTFEHHKRNKEGVGRGWTSHLSIHGECERGECTCVCTSLSLLRNPFPSHPSIPHPIDKHTLLSPVLSLALPYPSCACCMDIGCMDVFEGCLQSPLPSPESALHEMHLHLHLHTWRQALLENGFVFTGLATGLLIE